MRHGARRVNEEQQVCRMNLLGGDGKTCRREKCLCVNDLRSLGMKGRGHQIDVLEVMISARRRKNPFQRPNSSAALATHDVAGLEGAGYGGANHFDACFR